MSKQVEKLKKDICKIVDHVVGDGVYCTRCGAHIPLRVYLNGKLMKQGDEYTETPGRVSLYPPETGQVLLVKEDQVMACFLAEGRSSVTWEYREDMRFGKIS